MRNLLGATLLAIAVTGSGCGTTEDDVDGPGGKGDGTGTCTDPMYGDGTCQLDLACGIPDIDCFHTFATDAEAGSWLDTVWPVAQVAESDPRFVRARALLDRAWPIYTAEEALGTLAEHRLALVLIDDATPNAFAISDPERGQAALTVHIHTGILDQTDEALLGVIFHELAHITKLHVFPEIKDRTRRFYVATDSEPIGAQQLEHGKAKEYGTAWMDASYFVGPYDAVGFDELPYGGNLGSLFDLYLASVATSYPECAAKLAAVQALYTAIAPGYSGIDRSITVPPAVTATIRPTLDALGACVATRPWTLAQFLQQATSPEWVDYITMTELPEAERWLLDEDAFEVITLLAGDRRAKQRALQAAFTRQLGQPWSHLRYFSTEEHADDVAVELTQAAKLPEPGVSGLMLSLMATDRATCEGLIAAGGLVPYGVDLADDHHGECWRVAHAQQLARSSGTAARLAAHPVPTVPHVPTRRPDGKPMY
ncbi:MAG: M48 family metalloprotease [Myxococcota bacterium]|nr:M48 family metalloprotease [Myxococcota bacterium]